MKVVVNRCFGGFGLSHKAIMLYAKYSGFKVFPFTDKRDEDKHLIRDEYVQLSDNFSDEDVYIVYYSKQPLVDGKYAEDSWFYDRDIKRDDPILIKVVEELGGEADGRYADLQVVEIPDGINWEIDDYDGQETVEEAHRSW